MAEIIWSNKAELNLDKILEEISLNSPQNVKSFLNGVFKIIENLTLFPRIGRKVPELNDPQYRELTIRHAHRLLNMDKI